jgi:NadR type nicotinamide-nucleotide adenylyltransferase
MDGQPDFLFASEDYGIKLAQVLGARFIPVDHERLLFPISGTAIREDPMTNWQYLLPAARPWFLKRIAIVGPESSGKSTLARHLASRFSTCYVPEYGRSYLDAVGFNLDEDAIVTIARGHRASEDALARQANRVLISDTECLITKMWSAELIGSVPDIVEEMVRESRYDLYLVSTATEAWVADAQRVQPEIAARRGFEMQCVDSLAEMGRKYLILAGDWRQREEQAFAAISNLILDVT